MPFDTPVLTCENEKEMSEQLTNFVVTSYNEAVEERGRFAIALTGGRALTLLARRITEEPFISYIDWTKWYLFFVDERCASLDNPCSSYYMVDQALLQHVRIPEMQVFPAYDPLLSLDKRGHSCEAAALAYEERMRSVLGAENGLPALDLVLVGSDVSGNVASLFPEHPMCEHRVRNYESTWGAEGKFRDLLPTQAVCAMYECPQDLYDVVLSKEEMMAAKRRGIPAERVALTLKTLNHAHNILVTVADPASGPLLKEYFEGPQQGEKPLFERSGLYLLHGRSGRPRLFAQRASIDGFIALPQLLRTFQVQDLAFSITEARESAPPPATSSDSDSEGEEYARRLKRQEAARAASYDRERASSRRNSVAGSPASPLGTPMRKPAKSTRQLPTGQASIKEEEEGQFIRTASFGRASSNDSKKSFGRTRSNDSKKGKGKGEARDDPAFDCDAEVLQADEPERAHSADAPQESDVIIPDHFVDLAQAVAHVQALRVAAARAASAAPVDKEVLGDTGAGNEAVGAGGRGPGRAPSFMRHHSTMGSSARGGSFTNKIMQAQEQHLNSVKNQQLSTSRISTSRIYIRAGCYAWEGVVKVPLLSLA